MQTNILSRDVDLPRRSERCPSRASMLGIAGSFGLHVVVATCLLTSTPTLLAPSAPPQLELVELERLDSVRSGVLGDSISQSGSCLDGKPYVGIGLQFDLDDIVINAPDIYPAHQAGIRIGDRILNPDFEPDAQGYAHVQFQHGGKRHRVSIKAQWICLR